MAMAGAGQPRGGRRGRRRIARSARPPWWRRVNVAILAAGALAVAILSIVALVELMLPDDEPEAPVSSPPWRFSSV